MNFNARDFNMDMLLEALNKAIDEKIATKFEEQNKAVPVGTYVETESDKSIRRFHQLMDYKHSIIQEKDKEMTNDVRESIQKRLDKVNEQIDLLLFPPAKAVEKD